MKFFTTAKARLVEAVVSKEFARKTGYFSSSNPTTSRQRFNVISVLVFSLNNVSEDGRDILGFFTLKYEHHLEERAEL